MTKVDFLKENKEEEVNFTGIHRLYSIWTNKRLDLEIHAPLTSKDDIYNNEKKQLKTFLGWDYDPEEIVLIINKEEIE